MKCQNCGNEFASGKFCSECGALLPAEEAVKPEVTANSVKAEAPAAVPLPEEQAKVSAESAAEEKPAAEEAAEESVAEAPAAEEGVTAEQGAPVAEENAPQPAGETVSGSAPESAPEAVSGNAPESAPEAVSENAPESAPEAAPLPVAETGGAAETAADAAQTQNAPGSAGGNGGSSNAKFEEIKGKIRAVCEKVKAKLGEKAYKGIGLWTPAVLPVVWGVLIMLFLAASGVSVDGFSFGSGYDVMSGSFGGGAAFGAVMCLLIALAYIGIGIFRIVLAVKKPYFTPKFVVPTQLALYGLLFLMSCVMVGSVNTVMGGAYSGPAGNCVLAFTLLGAFFVAAGILLFRFGCVDELVQARKIAAAEYAEERKNKIAAAQAAAANAAQAAAAAGAAAVSAGAAGASAQVVYVQGKSEPSMEDKLFGDLPVGKKIENYRWSGAVASLVAVLFIAIAGVMPLIKYSTGGSYAGFSFVYSFFDGLFGDYSDYYYSAGVVAGNGIFFVLELLPFALCALFAFIHLLIAIRQPYTQHPVFGMFQWLFTVSAAGFMMYIVVFNGIYYGSFDYIVSTVIAMILLSVVLAGCIFGVPLYIICARTDQNRYAIKKKRLEIKENPESDKSNATPRKIFAVVVAVIALVTFILSVCMPLMVGSDRGMDTDTARSLTPGTSYSRVVEQLGEPYKVSNTSNGGKVAYWYSKDYRDIMGESSGSSGSDLDDIEDWEDFENALEDEMQAEAEREQQLNNLVYKYYEITFDSNDMLTYLVFDNNRWYRDSNNVDKVSSSARLYLSGATKASISGSMLSGFSGQQPFNATVSISYTDGSYESGISSNIYDFTYDSYFSNSFMYAARLSEEGIVLTNESGGSVIQLGNAALCRVNSRYYLMRSSGTALTSISTNSSLSSFMSNSDIYIDYTLSHIDYAIASIVNTGDVAEFIMIDGNTTVDKGIAYATTEYGGLVTSSLLTFNYVTLYFATDGDLYDDNNRYDYNVFDEYNIKTIASYAFAGVDNITSLTSMGPSASGYTGVTTLEDYAFANSSLTSVTIPYSVTRVGSYLFYGCDRGSVTLADRTYVPSAWETDWNVYNSGNNVWTVYDDSGNLI